MEISVLHNWVKFNGDYKAGVALYEHFGNDAALKFLFKLPYSKFNEQKLRKALNKVALDYPIQTVIPSKSSSGIIEVKARNKNHDYSLLPTELYELYKENVEMLAKRQYDHAELISSADDPIKLTNLASNIVRYGKLLKDNWKAIDEYFSTGKVNLVKNSAKVKELKPTAEPSKSENYYYLKNQIQLCRQNISKHRKRSNLDKVKLYEQRKKELENQLLNE